MSDEKLKVARELAEKNGISFDDITETDIMRGAYLHNAEDAIKDRQGIKVVAGKAVSAFTCPHCQDKAYIGGERCRECNPMGLPAGEVHPGAVVEEVDTLFSRTEFPSKESEGTINITVKREYSVKTPKKGEYLCTKCNTIHRQTSGVGKKHLEFKQ